MGFKILTNVRLPCGKLKDYYLLEDEPRSVTHVFIQNNTLLHIGMGIESFMSSCASGSNQFIGNLALTPHGVETKMLGFQG